MTKPKHIPTRTCAVCRTKDGKRAMTRLVKTENGVLVDVTGKLSGRGAYLCDNPECWQKAAQGEALNHALRTSLEPLDRERIRQHVL
jgi:uncharacterized protein